jgi:hypothetical protein
MTASSYDELDDACDKVMDVFKGYPNFTPVDMYFVLSVICAEIMRQFPIVPSSGEIPDWRKPKDKG